MNHKIVTLLTDFGTGDYFVAAMKGALLSVAPRAVIVDVTHDIPPHDIHAGAWTLANSYHCFPPGTVHVGVVDPGVGSARRAIAVRVAGAHIFVGPDNGLFSRIYQREQSVEVVELTNRDLFRRDVSRTFHGRDVFAPIAGALLNGVALSELGAEISNYVRLALPHAVRDENGTLAAQVIHVDRFGNLITNLTRGEQPHEMGDGNLIFEIGKQKIAGVRATFADGVDGELLAVWGSAGHLEIVVAGASAARLLGVGRGAAVKVYKSA
jgi:S-adenosylmethionine hydrolase